MPYSGSLFWPPFDWTSSVYVVSMWICTVGAFAVHMVVYKVGAEWKSPVRKTKSDPPIKVSAATSASQDPSLRRRRPDDDETRPLLESGEPEFGGIRASMFGGGGSERYSSKR